MKKVIIFITPHNNLFGAEKSLLAILKNVKLRGYIPVAVIRSEGPIESEFIRLNIEYIISPFEISVNTRKQIDIKQGIYYFRNNHRESKKLAHILRERYGDRIALVHTNSIVTDFGAMLAERLRVCHIQHIREFGDLDFNMEYCLGKRYAQWCFRKTSRFICISDAVLQHYASWLPTSKLIRIYNGINVEQYEMVKFHGVKPLKLLMVGRLGEEKGQMEAINAIHLVKEMKSDLNISLDFWGSGEYKDVLERAVNQYQLQNEIHFCGFSSSIPYAEYNGAIMASRAEAFGRVTVEYMLKGIPVIGARSGATTELISDKETGILYELGNPIDLAEKILFLHHNPELIERLVKDAYQYAVKNFSEDRYTNNVMNVLEPFL